MTALISWLTASFWQTIFTNNRHNVHFFKKMDPLGLYTYTHHHIFTAAQ